MGLTCADQNLIWNFGKKMKCVILARVSRLQYCSRLIGQIHVAVTLQCCCITVHNRHDSKYSAPRWGLPCCGVSASLSLSVLSVFVFSRRSRFLSCCGTRVTAPSSWRCWVSSYGKKIGVCLWELYTVLLGCGVGWGANNGKSNRFNHNNSMRV